MAEDTTPYPKLLTCDLCQAQHHTEHRDDWTAWANAHHAEHAANGECMVYTVLPLAAVQMAPLTDLGGGLRAYEPLGDTEPTTLHAHEITANDAALIRMMAGASFDKNSTVTLPSGKTITGAEMQRWIDANPAPE